MTEDKNSSAKLLEKLSSDPFSLSRFTDRQTKLKSFMIKNWTATANVPPSLKRGEMRTCRYVYTLDWNGVIFYVGESDDVRQRAGSHRYDAINANGKRPQTAAQRYLQAHGLPVFNVNVVATVYSASDNKKTTPESKAAELFWIEKLKAEGHPIQNAK